MVKAFQGAASGSLTIAINVSPSLVEHLRAVVAQLKVQQVVHVNSFEEGVRSS